ncbi:MAG: hypothetical protein KW788_03910 [Candidatus Doudnabacteria bacterium]|nr:hypothetical protein [Candidatus Doudnabacteria bacterium]
MKLTTADVARFVGGQIEVQNNSEGYLYRGEIAEISVDEAKKSLNVRLAWMAKMGDDEWVKDEELNYAASFEIYSASDIGPGETGGNRIHLSCWINHESTTLFPPDGSKLDRSKVKGLDPVPA